MYNGSDRVSIRFGRLVSMQIMLQVFTLFLLMMCGFCARKTRMMGDEAFTGLNRLVLYFAQPALILSSMQ